MRIPVLALTCLLSAGGPVVAQTNDASGRWDITFTTPQGDRPASLTLRRDGEKLTGTLSSPLGETPVDGTQSAEAVKLAFTVQTSDGPVSVTMTGTQTGDSMRGSADYGRAQGEWSATRAAAAAVQQQSTPVDVSGQWLLDVTTGMGSGTPTVSFKQEGEKLTGHYSGQLGEAPLTGTIKGAEITFTIDVTVEGQAIRIVYAGTVDKDTMKGTVTFGEMGEGTFTGKRR